MTDPIEEQVYRRPRQHIFAATLTCVIAAVALCLLLAVS